MSGSQRPDGAGQGGSDRRPAGDDSDLEGRSRRLEAELALRRPAQNAGQASGDQSRGMAGFGNALRLSSEFIAGVLVGAGLGWFIDHLAGTSPWGLIVFLLLGFAAGVFNVLRAAGQMAEFGARNRDGQDRR